MASEKEVLVERMLELTEELFDLLTPGLSLDRLASDITVAQLRVVFALRTGGPSPMSAVAEAAGVVPSTATGIVDNLVAKGMVLREDDPADRRRVICRLSPEGQGVVDGLWTWGRAQVEKLLNDLTAEQLATGCEAAELLRDTATRKGVVR